MASIFEKYDGDWAVVDFTSGKFVGRITSWDGAKMVMQPFFEFSAPLMQDRQGNVGRNVMVMPHDLLSSLDTPISIYSVSTVVKISDMEKEDRTQYESAINKAYDMVMGARLARSGISIEKSMPGGNSPLIMR